MYLECSEQPSTLKLKSLLFGFTYSYLEHQWSYKFASCGWKNPTQPTSIWTSANLVEKRRKLRWNRTRPKVPVFSLEPEYQLQYCCSIHHPGHIQVPLGRGSYVLLTYQRPGRLCVHLTTADFESLPKKVDQVSKQLRKLRCRVYPTAKTNTLKMCVRCKNLMDHYHKLVLIQLFANGLPNTNFIFFIACCNI